MWRRLQTSIFLLFFGAMLTTPALAQSPSASSLDLEVVENGPHFIAEEKVTLDKYYDGTVFVAGGEVVVSGAIEGDLVVAGGSVRITGEVSQDVYAAGGTVLIAGRVDGNVVAAGGELELAPSSEIGGSAIIAGESVQALGSILGKLHLAGRSVDLDGFVGQSAWIEGEEIRGQDRIAISGEQNVNEHPREERPVKQVSAGDVVGRVIFGFLWRSAFFLFFWWLVKPLIQRGARIVSEEGGQALLNGIAAMVLIPVAALVLLITVIGLPMAGVLFLLLLTFACTGWVFLAHALGDRVLARGTGWQKGLIGVGALAILGALPVIGWVAHLIIGAWGMGVWIMVFRSLGSGSENVPAKKIKSKK